MKVKVDCAYDSNVRKSPSVELESTGESGQSRYISYSFEVTTWYFEWLPVKIFIEWCDTFELTQLDHHLVDSVCSSGP